MIIALLLMLHKIPFISQYNFKLIDSIKFAPDSAAFTMYLNFDKPLVAVLVFILFGFSLQKKFKPTKIAQTVLLCLVPCALLILSYAAFSGLIRWDPKFPAEAFIFLLNNLFLTCIAEEAFFRRYVQGGLQGLFNFKYGQVVALLFASLIFGFAHFQGGVAMMALSTLAGLFYGLSYSLTGRIEAAVLTHFGFNAIHFLFFSYPFLN